MTTTTRPLRGMQPTVGDGAEQIAPPVSRLTREVQVPGEEVGLVHLCAKSQCPAVLMGPVGAARTHHGQ